MCIVLMCIPDWVCNLVVLQIFGGGAPRWRTVNMASRTIVSKRKEASKAGENFKVAVRVRPLIAREIRSNASLVSYAVCLIRW